MYFMELVFQTMVKLILTFTIILLICLLKLSTLINVSANCFDLTTQGAALKGTYKICYTKMAFLGQSTARLVNSPYRR